MRVCYSHRPSILVHFQTTYSLYHLILSSGLCPFIYDRSPVAFLFLSPAPSLSLYPSLARSLLAHEHHCSLLLIKRKSQVAARGSVQPTEGAPAAEEKDGAICRRPRPSTILLLSLSPRQMVSIDSGCHVSRTSNHYPHVSRPSSEDRHKGGYASNIYCNKPFFSSCIPHCPQQQRFLPIYRCHSRSNRGDYSYSSFLYLLLPTQQK